MKNRKNKKKNHIEPELTREEMVYEAARELAADVGMSFSEALGFTLGIKEPTYGWEDELTEEELQELINNPITYNENNEDLEDIEVF